MKNFIFMLLLMISGNVMAEWTLIGENYYADFSSIHKKNNNIKIWFMNNFKSPMTVNKNVYLSAAHKFEFNCEEEQFKVLETYIYSEKSLMGNSLNFKSEILTSELNYFFAWSSPPPNTWHQFLMHLTCDKKFRNSWITYMKNPKNPDAKK